MNRAALIWRSSLDLLFDQVKCGDALHGLGRDGRLMRLNQVEELASDVGHAWRFLNRAALIKLVETSKRVGLQYALELGQMPLWVFTLAVRRICKPHSRRGLVASRTVVTNVSPEAAGLGLACSRGKYRQRSIVPMQLLRIEHIAAQNFGHRRQQHCCFTYPAGKNGAIQIDAFAGKDLRLTIQRLVVTKLRSDNVCQHARS